MTSENMKCGVVLLRSGLRSDGLYFTREAIIDLAEREGLAIEPAADGELEIIIEAEVQRGTVANTDLAVARLE